MQIEVHKPHRVQVFELLHKQAFKFTFQDLYSQYFRQPKELDDCWLWHDVPALKSQYGRIALEGVSFPAHRISWLFDRKILIHSQIFICHTCDIKACVNPRHLFAGTHIENILDRQRKIRGVFPTKADYANIERVTLEALANDLSAFKHFAPTPPIKVSIPPGATAASLIRHEQINRGLILPNKDLPKPVMICPRPGCNEPIEPGRFHSHKRYCTARCRRTHKQMLADEQMKTFLQTI